MDEKMNEIIEEVRSMKEQLSQDREALEAQKRDLEKRQAEFENPSVKREREVTTQLRDVVTAMKEKRAITLSGAGAVEVVNELFKVFRNKKVWLGFGISAAVLVLTVLGLITFVCRIFDAVTDPWIASLSDRSKNPKGRRIPFMQKVGAELTGPLS